MPDALISLAIVAVGVLIVVASGAIARKIVSSQDRASRRIGGPYERLVATPEGSRSYMATYVFVRCFVALVGIAWVVLAIVGFLTS